MVSPTESKAVQVLLAEDNEDDRVIMIDALEHAAELEIASVARDGREALSYLRREGQYEAATAPDLVMLDINMPHRNGFEVLAEMKADRNLMHIPVVMLTTSNREEDVLRSYREGACSYVLKPVDFSDFSRVIDDFCTYWSNVSQVPPSISA